jgi:ketosteroid isomerase-like protein
MKRIFTMFVFTAAVAGYAFGECSSDEKRALTAFDHAWGEASVAGDRSRLTGMYADDFVGMPEMQGKAAALDAAVKAAEQGRMDPKGSDKVTYDHYLITCTPSSATITHRNTINTQIGEGGKPQTYYTRSVHVLEKRGGKWLVVGNAGSGLDDQTTLWYLEQDYNEAIQKQDRKWFEANYAPDFTSITGTTARLMNKAEDIADTVNDKVKIELAETTDISTRIDGTTAIITGVFRVKGKDEKGAAFDRRSRYTDVWIKRDGRWQVWSSQGSLMQ